MDRVFLAMFMRENFSLCFGKAGPKTWEKRLFLMDNDPSQTSKKAMSEIESKLLRTSLRSSWKMSRDYSAKYENS